MRTDEGGEVDLRVEVARGEATVSVTEVHVPARSRSPGSPGQWFEIKASLPDISGGDRVQIFASRGFWRSFHLWLLRR